MTENSRFAPVCAGLRRSAPVCAGLRRSILKSCVIKKRVCTAHVNNPSHVNTLHFSYLHGKGVF
jgi:hypothetical protein